MPLITSLVISASCEKKKMFAFMHCVEKQVAAQATCMRISVFKVVEGTGASLRSESAAFCAEGTSFEFCLVRLVVAQGPFTPISSVQNLALHLQLSTKGRACRSSNLRSVSSRNNNRVETFE